MERAGKLLPFVVVSPGVSVGLAHARWWGAACRGIRLGSVRRARTVGTHGALLEFK